MQINSSPENLAQQKLFVATPMYGGQCMGMYAKSMCDLTALCTRYNIQLQFHALFNESLITRARNYCSDEFLRSDMNHMLFLDADIGFNAQDVIAMMLLMTSDSEYHLMGAPYAKKCISWEKVVQAVNKGMADKNPNVLEKYVGDYVFNPKAGQQQIPLVEPCEVFELGTGFMMIRKENLIKFRDSYPEYFYRPDHVRTENFDGSREILQFFQAEIDVYNPSKDYEKLLKMIKDNPNQDFSEEISKTFSETQDKINRSSKRYLSEDYWFTRKCQEIGLKTWLCPWMKTTHTGSIIFGGSLMDLAEIGASPTANPELLKKNIK